MRSNAYEFAAIVDREIESLSSDDFRRRVGRSKVLQEELYPLSRLALHLKVPGLRVEVEGFEDNGTADGFIRIDGFRERAFEVQLTYAGYSHDEALRAELLQSQGYSPGAGPIRKDKRVGPIVATMGAVDCGEHVGRIKSAVVSRFRDKASKHYSRDTVLLIAFDEVKFRGHENWKQLHLAIEAELSLALHPFAEVFVFNGETNELRKAA